VDYPDGQDREFTTAEIIGELERGAIDGATLVWREGMSEWLELKNVPELARELRKLETTQRAAPLTLKRAEASGAEAVRMHQPRPPQPTVTGLAPAEPLEGRPKASPQAATSNGQPVRRTATLPSSPEAIKARASLLPRDEITPAERTPVVEVQPPRQARPSLASETEELTPTKMMARPVIAGLAQPMARAPQPAPAPLPAPKAPVPPAAAPRAAAPPTPPPPEATAPPAAVLPSPPLPLAPPPTPPLAAPPTPPLPESVTKAMSQPPAPVFPSAPASVRTPAHAAAQQPLPAFAEAGVEFPKAKSRAPLVAAAAVILIAIVVAIVMLTGKPDTAPAGSPTPPAAALEAKQDPVTREPAPEPAAEPAERATPTEAPGAAPHAQAPTSGQPEATPGADFAELFAAGARKAESKGASVAPAQRFDPASTRAALNRAVGEAVACKEPGGPAGKVTVVVTFEPSGKVSTANVTEPPFAGTATGNCISAAFKRATIDPFSGLPGTVSKSFSMH
jgi:hypothetical protein